MTVIFVITKTKYFNDIEETAQTICMDFINDIVSCIIDCLYQIVPDMFLCISCFQSWSSTENGLNTISVGTAPSTGTTLYGGRHRGVDCITRICRTMRRSHTWEIDGIAFAAANRAHDAHHASVCSGRGQGKSGSIERVEIEP